MNTDASTRPRVWRQAAVIAGVVALAIAIVFGESLVAEWNARDAQREITKLASGIELNATKELVADAFARGDYEYLQLRTHGTLDQWFFHTPRRFGATDWILHVTFDHGHVISVSVRTSDSLNHRPEAAPPDRTSRGPNGAPQHRSPIAELPSNVLLRPEFDYTNSHACFSIQAYSINDAGTEVLSVQLQLGPRAWPSRDRPLVLNLAHRSGSTEAHIDVYRTNRHNSRCGDVMIGNAETPTRWTAARGTLTVVAERPKEGEREYPVTIRIRDAEFIGPGGVSIRAPKTLEIKTVGGRLVGG